MLDDNDPIYVLNQNVDLDFFTGFNRDYYDALIDDSPYHGITVSSEFYDVHSFVNSALISGKTLYLSINIQSLQSKHEHLSSIICDLEKNGAHIEVIALQEIWNINYPELLIIDGYKPLMYKKRRGMRGGGVGFYIKNNLNAEIIEHLSPFEEKIIEALTITISYPDSNKHVLCTSVYRSNGIIHNVTSSQQMERFMSKFTELLDSIQQTKKESYIFIDSNIDLLNLRNLSVSNYMNLIIEKSFLQGISKATRMQNDSKTLIDHILFNTECESLSSGVIVSDVSDHFFTFIVPPNRRKNVVHNHQSIYSRNYSLQNLNNFKITLGTMDWTSVLSCVDVNLAYSEFWSKYKTCHDLHFPLSRKRFNKNIHKRQPFITNGLLISRNTKIKLHKKAVADPSVGNIQRYKTYKTLYCRILRGAKKMYYTSKLNENLKNPKKTWETLNEILGKNKKKDDVSQINIEGTPESDPTKIANHFNQFFTSIGKKISNDVPPVDKQPEEYINYGRPIPELNLQNTTPEHVLKTIKKSKNKNSCDIHGISAKMVKFVGAEVSIPLAHIFNRSLESGVFPEMLKQCRVIPIFKSGNHMECDNYRPISLLSSISKVLEKIVAEKLLFHLTENDLLYTHQYGFIPKKSAEHNLMHVINFVSSALNDGNFCVGVFLDLKKAFDVCSHSILLKKLKKMGINGVTHSWFANYLSGRSQKVEINEKLSEEQNLDISVIQGSILGPILFLCYINDFYSATSLFSVLFADDTACLSKGKNLNDLLSYVTQELQKIAVWFRSNKMAVNTSKTKYIIFRTQGKRINNNDCVLVFNSNEPGRVEDPALISTLERIYNDGPEPHFKLLGVLLDEYLSFDAHISQVCVKISKSLFCINRVKNFVNKDALQKLYYAMVHSHLTYCVNIYSCANTTNLQRLRVKQKESIRIINNAGYRDHTVPLFKATKILPLDALIKFSKLKFMHNFVYHKLPFSFREMWTYNADRNPNRILRNANDLTVPAHHFATIKRLPLFEFPRSWNEEEENRKSIQSSYIYCKQLKTFLLASLVD
jgi:hypothetical protein